MFTVAGAVTGAVTAGAVTAGADWALAAIQAAKLAATANAENTQAQGRDFSGSGLESVALIMRGPSLLEEIAVGVRAMYLHVAGGAGLVLIGLVME